MVCPKCGEVQGVLCFKCAYDFEQALRMTVVGLLFAATGEYEEYRARPCEVYATMEAAKAEANRRNALVKVAREKAKDFSWEDDNYDKSERKQVRLMNKLRRETGDKDTDNWDLHDLNYFAQEARFIK